MQRIRSSRKMLMDTMISVSDILLSKFYMVIYILEIDYLLNTFILFFWQHSLCTLIEAREIHNITHTIINLLVLDNLNITHIAK